jgi:hypothetical protein
MAALALVQEAACMCFSLSTCLLVARKQSPEPLVVVVILVVLVLLGVVVVVVIVVWGDEGPLPGDVGA